MQRRILIIVGLLILVFGVLYWVDRSKQPLDKTNIPIEPAASSSTIHQIPEVSTVVAKSPVVMVQTPLPIKKVSPPATKSKVSTPPKDVVPSAPVVAAPPPPTVIHKELIPKNIEIVRVYYSSDLMAPGAETEFDINGTGFTKEFGQMITAQSGQPGVQIKDLKYVTLNQIHGRLVVSPNNPTAVGFPQVLINGKVVFQAPEPYAVIRPGEVLNVVFTEMGESGRSGKFRIYTNLTPDTFSQLKVLASTPSIQVVDLKPQFPFIVDATVQIGPALVGEYGMSIELGSKKLWERPGSIRIVQPDAADPGLAQRVKSTEGFYRPNDVVKLVVQGSGFQPRDIDLLQINVPGWGVVSSSWVFVAPGRLDCVFQVPSSANMGVYHVQIIQGKKELLNGADVFSIVPENWVRQFRLDPPLKPGKTSALIIEGRDLKPDFVSKLKASFDEEGLSVDSFNLMDQSKVVAGITAKESVSPGDYLMKLTAEGRAVVAFSGNIIRVSP